MQERMPVLREEKKRSRSSRKLLFFLLLLFITLLAVLFFRSSLSEIARIEITGQSALAPEEIGQASGVVVGDNFFGFRSASVEERIRQLPAVEGVIVRKKFPGLLKIEVSEYPQVAFQVNASGGRELLLANGLAVPAKDASLVTDKPILSGWRDDDPWKTQLCEALRRIPDNLLAEISEIKPSPTNVYEDKIKMYTRSQFEVYTTVKYLPDKIKYLEEMMQMMDEQKVDSGVLELLEANTFIPFEMYYDPKKNVPNGSDSKSNGSKTDGTKTDAKDTQKNAN